MVRPAQTARSERTREALPPRLGRIGQRDVEEVLHLQAIAHRSAELHTRDPVRLTTVEHLPRSLCGDAQHHPADRLAEQVPVIGQPRHAEPDPGADGHLRQRDRDPTARHVVRSEHETVGDELAHHAEGRGDDIEVESRE